MSGYIKPRKDGRPVLQARLNTVEIPLGSACCNNMWAEVLTLKPYQSRTAYDTTYDAQLRVSGCVGSVVYY